MSAAFEKYFKDNYKPVPGVDRNTAALLRMSAREAFVVCWNTALNEATEALHGVYEYPKATEIITALKVTKGT